MFMPGDETRVVVTSEATQNIVLVNIESGTVEGAIPTSAQGSHMVGLTRGRHARVDVERRHGRGVGDGSREEGARARDPDRARARRGSRSRPTAARCGRAATRTAP